MAQKSNSISKITPNIISLFLVNVLVIIQAVVFEWNYGTVLWTYYLQTVAILLIAYFSNTKKKKYESTMLFVGFYGLFFLVFSFVDAPSDYAAIRDFSNTQWLGVFAATTLFTVNHLLSFIWDGRKNIQVRSGDKISTRILALHLSFFIAVTSIPVVLFMILKTFTDIWSHQLQHNYKK